MEVSESIHDLLAATLAELGVPAPAEIIQSVLIKDRYFVGHKFRFAGGHAIWRADSNSIEIFNEQGTLLKTVAIDTTKNVAA